MVVAQLVFQPISSYALIVFPVKYWVVSSKPYCAANSC